MPKVTVNAKVKRRREIRTCEYCYNHKLKCDRAQPCTTCVRRKQDCVYHFQQKKAVHNEQQSQYQSPNQDQNQNPTPEGYAGHILQHVASPQVIGSPVGLTPNFGYNSNSSTTGDSNDSKRKRGRNEKSDADTDANASDKTKKKPETTFVSNIASTPLYYSRAFFPYLEPSLNRMMLFKMSEIGEGGQVKTDVSHTGTYDFQRFGTPLSTALSQLAEEYPKKERFDDIIYHYWDYIHPLVPVVDQSLTMAKYVKFWKDFNDPENPKFDIDSGVLFLAMLLAVKTAFEVNEQNEQKHSEITNEKNKLYDTFERFKLIFGFRTNPNLAYIQSSIILYQSSCMYYVGIFTYTAALARQAEFMGLHRDPLLHDIYPNKKNMKEVEVRRQVWHFVRILDTASSIVSGMSPHMIMINASAKFPSKREYNPQTNKFDGELNPFKIFTICRFKCSLVMETISHFLNSDFSSDHERILRWEGMERTVIALYQDINSLVKEIFSCEKDPKYTKVLLRWLVSSASIECHRVFLLHKACDRRPYSHHNRVILKPANAACVELTRLSQANSNKDFFDQVLTIRMPYVDSTIEVSILLLYETRFRIRASPELTKYKWYSKNANPFQYLFFVIRDIFHFPDKRYNLNNLPAEIKSFIHEDTLLKFSGDIRRYVIDQSLKSLAELKDFWAAPIKDMMNFLCELRKYAFTANSSSGPARTKPSKSDSRSGTDPDPSMVRSDDISAKSADTTPLSRSNEGGPALDTLTGTYLESDDFDLLLNSDFQADKYKTVIQMLSVFNKDQSPNQQGAESEEDRNAANSDLGHNEILPQSGYVPDPMSVPVPVAQPQHIPGMNSTQFQPSFLKASGASSNSMDIPRMQLQTPIMQHPNQPPVPSSYDPRVNLDPSTGMYYGTVPTAQQIPSSAPQYALTLQQVQHMQQMRHVQHMHLQAQAQSQPLGQGQGQGREQSPAYMPVRQQTYPYMPTVMGAPLAYTPMPPANGGGGARAGTGANASAGELYPSAPGYSTSGNGAYQ